MSLDCVVNKSSGMINFDLLQGHHRHDCDWNQQNDDAFHYPFDKRKGSWCTSYSVALMAKGKKEEVWGDPNSDWPRPVSTICFSYANYYTRYQHWIITVFFECLHTLSTDGLCIGQLRSYGSIFDLLSECDPFCRYRRVDYFWTSLLPSAEFCIPQISVHLIAKCVSPAAYSLYASVQRTWLCIPLNARLRREKIIT